MQRFLNQQPTKIPFQANKKRSVKNGQLIFTFYFKES